MPNERNYGIDLLRIIATYMICVLHVLGWCGVVENTEYLSPHWVTAWGLEKLVLCCVNCYGLISGFVGVTSRHRLGSLLRQWLQVVFYSAGITLLFAVLLPQKVTLGQAAASFAPVATYQYWYFSAYTGLFLFMPMLNHVVNSMDGKKLGRRLLVISAAFTLPTAFLNTEPFALGGGYSTLWLMLLYLVGAWIRRYGQSCLKRRWWLLIYLICCLGMHACKMVSDYTFLRWNFRVFIGMYSAFTSPLALLCGVSLLQVFSRLRIQKPLWQRVILWGGAASFGVYLIHVHPCIWHHVLIHRFAWVSEQPIPAMIGLTLLISAGIMLLCLVIEALRMGLFRLVGVHRFADRIGANLEFSLKNEYTDSTT